MNHIFISYAREDEYAVTGLASLLRQAGLDVWQDTSGEFPDATPGSKWYDITEGAMYDAIGAIIIHSDNWKDAVNCSVEYEMIVANSLPYLIIDLSELDDTAALIAKLKNWYSEYVDREKNRMRAVMFSQAYHYHKNKHAFHLMVKKKKLGNAWSYYSDLKKFLKLLDKEGYTYNNKKADEWIRDYIKKIKHKIFVTRATKATITFAGLIAVVVVFVLVRTLPANFKTNSYSDGGLYFSKTGKAREITDVGDTTYSVSYKDTPGGAHTVSSVGGVSEDGNIEDVPEGDYEDVPAEDAAVDNPDGDADAKKDSKVKSAEDLYPDDENEGIVYRDNTGKLTIGESLDAIEKYDREKKIKENSELSGKDTGAEAAANKLASGSTDGDKAIVSRAGKDDTFPVSPSAEAVSEDGKLKAYGYADGSLLVTGTDNTDEIFVINSIEESIAAVYFSDDNDIIYAIGKSGKTYKADLSKQSGLLDQDELNSYYNKYLKHTKRSYETKWRTTDAVVSE